MPLRRTQRSDGLKRPRWKDGSHFLVENTNAKQSRCDGPAFEPNTTNEPLETVQSLLELNDELNVSTRDRPARTGADARIEGSAANGGSAPCDPTLWNAKQASFSAPPLSTFLTNSPRRGENGPYWELECPVECARHGRARSALRPARYSPPHASSAWKPVDGTRYWALQASPLTGSKRPFSSTGNRIGCPGYTSGRTFEFFTTRVPFTTT